MSSLHAPATPSPQPSREIAARGDSPSNNETRTAGRAPVRASASNLQPAAQPPPDLGDLVRSHQAEVWRYLRYLGAEPTEAEDLTQETFLAVARSRFEWQGERQTAGYLRTAARHQLLQLRRRQKRQISTVDLEAAESVWADQTASGGWSGLVDQLGVCLEKLQGNARRAVELQYRDRASRTEIADQLGMKPDGVKTLLRRTRQLLRECLERSR